MDEKDVGLQKQKTRKWWRIGGFVLTGLVLFPVAFTQYLAFRFDYQAALGAPLVGKFYWPWKCIVWWQKYQTQAPKIFQDAAYMAFLGFVLFMGLLLYLAMSYARRSSAIKDLHGSARWATAQEMRDAGLLVDGDNAAPGVTVGGWDDHGTIRPLRHNGPEHIMSFAPTRSGKGVGQVLPTLLTWQQSVVVHDIKGENYELTAGWRKSIGHKILKFDPASPDAGNACYNPLREVRIGTIYDVGDAQNIASIVSTPVNASAQRDAHFDPTAEAFIAGVIIHVCYKCSLDGKVADMGMLDDALSGQSDDALYDEMQHTNHVDGKPHQAAWRAAQDQKNRDPRERGGVLSTAKRFLALYRDPIVRRNLGRSDFRIRDLVDHAHPVALYLIVRPENKDRFRPLIRLMVSQIVRVLTREMKFEEGRSVQIYKHRLLLMLDEFASLGKLDILQESLAYIAGYGMKAFLIVQDTTQLEQEYGQNETITSNCHIKCAYAPNKPETAKKLSEMTGVTTIIKKQTTTSGKRFGTVLSQSSETLQEHKRPLLTPDEVSRLPAPRKTPDGSKITKPGEMLVFVTGMNAARGKQYLFFQNPQLLERSQMPAPRQSDRIT
jgi:type IV secretion system protein VirD4